MTKPKPFISPNPARILIIKPSALGDIVNCLPFLQGIRCRFPEAKIAWVIHKGLAPLLENHSAIDQLIPFDRDNWSHSWGGGIKSFLSLIKTIRSFKADLAIDLQCLFRTGLMCGLSGAKVKLGLEDCREGSRFFYTHLVHYPRPGKMHAVERYWEAAKMLGCTEEIPSAPIQVNQSLKDSFIIQLGRYPRPWIGCVPGARWHTKRWPTDYFTALLKSAMGPFGGTVVFLGGKDDIPLSLEIQKNLNSFLDFTGKTNLPELVTLISCLDLVVSNDTGPMHIAVGQNIRVISPFLCTKPEWNGPFGQLDNTVCAAVPCQGSYLKKCPKMICLEDLVPGRLIPVLEKELQAWKEKNK